MSMVKFFKVSTLPGTLESNSFYFVINGDYVESYLTGSTGIAKSIGNTSMIQDVALKSLGGSRFKIVGDIAAMNALKKSDYPYLILVLDATDDESVKTGAALYAYEPGDVDNFEVPNTMILSQGNNHYTTDGSYEVTEKPDKVYYNGVEAVETEGSPTWMEAGEWEYKETSNNKFRFRGYNNENLTTEPSGFIVLSFITSEHTYHKVAEYESMDIDFGSISIAWSQLTGAPTSAVTDIDDAVTKRHTHTNKAIIDELNENGSEYLTYKGNVVGSFWSTLNW